MKIGISGLMRLLGVVIAVGVVVEGLAVKAAMDQIKVNGPVYQRVVLNKDLVADILPPPAYVIESYLVASQAFLAESKEAATAFLPRLAELRKQYTERYTFWLDAAIPPTTKETLTVRSHRTVTAFYEIAERLMFPALATADRPAAEAAYRELGKAYETHRKLIDEVVAMAEREGTATETYAATLDDTLTRAIWIGIALMLALVVGVLALVTRRTVRPLRQMATTMGQLAAGDTGIEIPARNRADEIGRMAEAVQVFKDGMVEATRLRGEQSEQERRTEVERRAAMVRFADEFDATVGRLIDTLSGASRELRGSAESMSAAVESAAGQAATVATAAEQAAVVLQTIAAAGHELSASVDEVRRQVEQSTDVAGRATAEAERADAKVQLLSGAATRIEDVVKLISDIAGQTNMLALNATIEAARAGEAGKGFAVVAGEVKSLANQTGRATGEISGQIGAIQSETRESVAAIESIRSTIAEIGAIAASIDSAVGGQRSATQEIARNVEQAAQGTADVSASIAQVSATTADVGAAAVGVLDRSGELARHADALRREVDGFLAKVRAA